MMVMVVSWGAFLQTCLIMMVRANQHNLRETSCDLNAEQSELNSFLWTIKRDPPSYFYGTIHVPYTRVWDFIPENSKKAFQESNIVYFELDLTDPYTISALTSCQLLPQGENLQDVLPKDIYRRLKRHLEYVKLMLPSWMTPDQRGKGLYADYLFNAIAGNWERKRPVWVMLMVNSLTEADIKTRGVPVLDLYLAQEAERMKKKTGAVEKTAVALSEPRNYRSPSERQTQGIVSRRLEFELMPYGSASLCQTSGPIDSSSASNVWRNVCAAVSNGRTMTDSGGNLQECDACISLVELNASSNAGVSLCAMGRGRALGSERLSAPQSQMSHGTMGASCGHQLLKHKPSAAAERVMSLTQNRRCSLTLSQDDRSDKRQSQTGR
ncbi:Metalloprotease TIKI1 [Labeo rohita]|uniref:Metalloprotease TIKI n=1 Tax=Labeo rohita TaxID=84645 RepID=A0ABQ8MSF7_LABRO|nr:Metalloprotease TIKI1 [Labeo rohita]